MLLAHKSLFIPSETRVSSEHVNNDEILVKYPITNIMFYYLYQVAIQGVQKCSCLVFSIWIINYETAGNSFCLSSMSLLHYEVCVLGIRKQLFNSCIGMMFSFHLILYYKLISSSKCHHFWETKIIVHGKTNRRVIRDKGCMVTQDMASTL